MLLGLVGVLVIDEFLVVSELAGFVGGVGVPGERGVFRCRNCGPYQSHPSQWGTKTISIWPCRCV